MSSEPLPKSSSFAAQLIRRFSSSKTDARICVDVQPHVDAEHPAESSPATVTPLIIPNHSNDSPIIQPSTDVSPVESPMNPAKRKHSYFHQQMFRDMDIYFGTTTGTAANFASLLAKSAIVRGVPARVLDLKDFHPAAFLGQENFQETKLVVFVVSTYGDGGPSDSAKRFHAWLSTEYILMARAEGNGGGSIRAVVGGGDNAADGGGGGGGDPKHDDHSGRHSARSNISSIDLGYGGVSGPSAASVSSCSGGMNSNSAVTPASADDPLSQNHSSSSSPSKGGSSIRKFFDFGKSYRQSKHMKTRFKGMNYAVFGVGSSTYVYFNGMAKFVDSKLHELGANRVQKVGLGDDSDDPEAQFLKWQLKLLKRLPAPPKLERSVVFSCSSSSSSSPPVILATAPSAVEAASGAVSVAPKRQAGDCPTVKEGSELVIRPNETPHAPTTSHLLSSSNQRLVQIKPEQPSVEAAQGSSTPDRPVDKRNSSDSPVTPAVDSSQTNNSAAAEQNTTTTTTGTGGRRPFLNRTSMSQTTCRPAAVVETIDLVCEDDSPLELPDFEAVAAAVCSTPAAAATSTSRPSMCDASLNEIKTRVVYLHLTLEEPICAFEAADNLAILPHNCQQLVESVAKRLKFDLDAMCEIPVLNFAPVNNSSNSTTSSNPTGTSRYNLVRSQTHKYANSSSFVTTNQTCSVRAALTDYLEIHAISREFIRQIADYAKVPKEREHLERLASSDGSQEFNRLFIQQHANLLVLLNLAPSLSLTFDQLIGITPMMKPRHYTIASSPLQDPKQIDLVISVRQEAMGLMCQYLVEVLGQQQMLPQQQQQQQQQPALNEKQNEETQALTTGVTSPSPTEPTGTESTTPTIDASSPTVSSHESSSSLQFSSTTTTSVQLPRGTCYSCSRVLSKNPSLAIRGFIAPSRFRLPSNPSAPLVMIANGAGIAPMHALLLHRQLLQSSGLETSAAAAAPPDHVVDQPSSPNAMAGKVLLLYGVRNRRSILFEKELRELDRTGRISLHLAFSRDREWAPVQYVQDLLASKLDQVVSLLLSSNESKVLVCGSVDMAKKVRHLFEVNAKAKATETNAVMTWFDAMRQSNRYVEEAWT